MALLTLAAAVCLHSSLPLKSCISRRFNLGSCVQVGLLQSGADGGKYADTLSRNFNLVEPENELKPPSIWRAPDQYDFSGPDFLMGVPGKIGWAQRNRIRVRGHVLVYARDDGYSIPKWLLSREKEIDSEQAKSLLKTYIQTVVGRYKGKIVMWDVANEAIDDRPNSRPYNLRDSFWFRKLGPEFLVLAFQYAHEADPSAELFYNEYGVEDGGEKANHLLDLAAYIRSHGGPINGLGLQYHVGLYEHIKEGDVHYQLLDRITSAHLSFMITELDVALPLAKPNSNETNPIPLNPDADLLNQQATLYRDIFAMAVSQKNCRGVQMWGFTDRYSWIPKVEPGKGAALLFDPDYLPKPAYAAVEAVLKNSRR